MTVVSDSGLSLWLISMRLAGIEVAHRIGAFSKEQTGNAAHGQIVGTVRPETVESRQQDYQYPSIETIGKRISLFFLTIVF